MAKVKDVAGDQLAVIAAIGRSDARTVAAVSEATGFDRRKVQRVLDGMQKGPPGDFYLDQKKLLKLGKRGVGRLRFPA